MYPFENRSFKNRQPQPFNGFQKIPNILKELISRQRLRIPRKRLRRKPTNLHNLHKHKQNQESTKSLIKVKEKKP